MWIAPGPDMAKQTPRPPPYFACAHAANAAVSPWRHRLVLMQLNIVSAPPDASLARSARDGGRGRSSAVAAVHEDAGDLPLAG
jgi:hypothetical protein